MNATIYKLSGAGVWAFAIETPHYDQDYIDAFKESIPSRKRKWDSTNKCWLIKEDCIEAALVLLRSYFGDFDYEQMEDTDTATAYADLHLLPSAPVEVVRAAYKALAKINHPDHGGDCATMQRINNSFSIIEQKESLDHGNN